MLQRTCEVVGDGDRVYLLQILLLLLAIYNFIGKPSCLMA